MNIAAYCRVSTDKADQLNSLEAQKEFFSEYTKRTGDTLVRLYADEGISGTKIKNRKEFLRMMSDAEHGLFDMVVVKDISRFARNTVDLLQNVRKLRSLGIETQFLTANMTSMGNSEFVLTIFGALAQEESANTSKRVKFGKKFGLMEVNKMLCQFTVKNFKSIRDEVTFDMQAAAISEHEDRIIKDVDEELYLPVSAVYGPNGGGKSNVLEALHSLVTKILRPLYATSNNEEIAMKMKKLVIEPFAFDEGTRNEPTEFELFFRTTMAEYRYELTVKKEVIEYERLDRIKLETGRKSALFERDEDEITLKGAFARLKTSDELSDTLPLLSYLGITYSKNEVVQDVLDWFDEEIDFLNYGNPMQELRMAISKSEDVKRLMLQMIQEMDLDIVDFRVEEKENDRIEVFTKHIVDEYEAELNLFDESSGTKKLFGLLPFIAKSLLKGTTLVIDELDAKIHPVLLKYLIMTFSNMEKNKKGAQLIFTSHDLSTMNSEVFRRDEIWFVAKGNRQNSKLYSLVEFKNKKGESVRKDAKFDKQYLEGKYGADPYLRKIIDWGTVNG